MANNLDVLTCSARDWCESEGKNLRDYVLIGIHDTFKFDYERLPRGTERITDYRFSNGGDRSSVLIAGTALVPRKK